MRNLKKILSLALALVMVMSLLTVAGAKDFNDADQIEHTEAVDVMSSLGIINGKGQNLFDPQGKVTRAEMAKMITYISLGNVEPTAFLGTTTNLTDINGHWGEAYIKYCYSQGIIAGRGNGIFAPDANVTATEAARMLLVAIGYNANVQVYTGPQWAINVVRDAQISKLYDHVSVVSEELLSRDKAAQMMYNALNAKTIQKISSVDRDTGAITDRYEPVGETLLAKSFDGQVWLGSFEGNWYTGAANALKGEITVKGDLEDAEDYEPTTPAHFPADFNIKYIGEQVKVIFKDGTAGTKGQPDKNDTIYGVFVTGATNVVNDIRGNVKDEKTTNARININGTKYDLDTSVDVYTNYFEDPVTYSGSQLKGNSTTNSALTTALKAKTGDPIKVVVDADNGKVNKIYITEYRLAAVTAVTSDKITLNNNVGTLDIADHDVYDGAARGDVAVVATLYDKVGEDKSFTTVAQAEVITGTMSGFKGTESVTVDGTTYKIHGDTLMLSAIPDKDVTRKFVDDDIRETFDLYMVNGYVGAAVMTSEGANNYSVVIGIKDNSQIDDTFDALQLQVMGADGTKTVITPSDSSKKANGTKATSNNDFQLGDIVVWSGDKNDADVTVKAEYKSASGQGYIGSAQYLKDTKTFNGERVSDNCVLFVETTATDITTNSHKTAPGAEFKAYSALTLDDTPAAAATYVKDSNNRVVAIFLKAGQAIKGSSGATVYAVVSNIGDRVRLSDDKWYYQVTAQANGETYTLYVDSLSTIGTSKGALISFEPASDEIYTTSNMPTKYVSGYSSGNIAEMTVWVDDHDANRGTLTYYGGDAAGFVSKGANGYEGQGNTKTLQLDDDCKIVYVDYDAKTSKAEGSISQFSNATGYKNASILVETVGGKSKIIAIFVETSDKSDMWTTSGSSVAATKTDIDTVSAPVSLPTTSTAAAPSTITLPSNVGSVSSDSSNKIYDGTTELFDIGTIKGQFSDNVSTKFSVAEIAIPSNATSRNIQVTRYATSAALVSGTGHIYQSALGTIAANASETVALILGDKQCAYFDIQVGANHYYYAWEPVTPPASQDPTADVALALTTPTPDASNTITGGGATKTVTVNVANATSSVVITGTKTAAQTVAVDGTNKTDVTAGGTDTAPTYTVDTSAIASAGGSKTFTLKVSENGKTDITYTVTVTVAIPATADVDLALTTPTPDASNTITGGGATKTVTVSVANATSSVVITGTKTAAQTVAVDGTNKTDVTAGGTDTAPTYTVDTSAIASAGGSKTFTLKVSENGKSDITYTVTVTVAN